MKKKIFLVVAILMCVSKQINDNTLYWKYKTYVIKIGFLPLYTRAIHLQSMIPFRLLFLAMSIYDAIKKIWKPCSRSILQSTFFNNLHFGYPSIQKCRMRLRWPRPNISLYYKYIFLYIFFIQFQSKYSPNMKGNEK